MRPAEPVHAVDLLDVERALLLRTLETLTPDEWLGPTVCAGWSVKDVAAHVGWNACNSASGSSSGDSELDAYHDELAN